MARFRFSLQSVLEHREMIEEQKQLAVARLESERIRLEGQIRRYQQGISSQFRPCWSGQQQSCPRPATTASSH